MAGINKNFVVKNGLEVASNLIIADDLTNSVGIATTLTAHTLHVNGGIGATDVFVTGIITSANLSVQGAVSFNDFSAITANISTLNATTLIFTPGIGSFSRLNIGTGGTVISTTDIGSVGIGTTNPTLGRLSVIGDAGVSGVLRSGNISVLGIGTIVNFTSTNITGTAGTIATLRSGTINAGTGNIVTGVTTNFTSTNSSITNLTGTAATITTLRSTTVNADTGNIVTGVTTNFTTTNATATNLTGTAATITTLRSTTVNVDTGNILSGVVTSISGTNLVYSGVSTFTNGPVLIGSGTSTGTLGQDLQVTGDAYISGNLGLGLTNPTNKLNVSGDGSITGIFTATTFSGNVNAGVGTITNITNTNLTGTAATITTLNSTTGNITTLRSTTANATTGYIVTGVTTNFTSTNATATNLTGTAATITTLSSTNGSITNITGTAGTITTLRTTTGNVVTLNAVTGVVTTISGSNATYTNLGITNINATGIITASSFVGNGSGITNLTMTPGGSNKQIQFNNGGLLAGTPQLFYDFSNNRIGLGSDVPATSLDLYGNATTEALYVRNTVRPQGYILSGVSASNFGRLGYYDGSVFGTLAINDGGGNVAISTNILTGTASQAFQVNSGGYFNGKVGIANTNPAGGLEISTAGSTSAAQLTLSGTGNNWINLSATGSAAPSFTTRSLGTKIVLYNTLSGSAADIALGTDSGVFWSSVQNTSSSFRWYGGTTLAATLSGTGAFSAVGGVSGTQLTSTVATGTAPLVVSSTTQVSNLNASLLEGYATATAATGNTIVRRDASGNITTGTITANLSSGSLSNYSETINALGNTGTAATINLANGNFVTATLTGNCVFTFTTGLTTGAISFTLHLTNDATPSRTITWPASVVWPNGTTPTRTTTANKTDVYTFYTLNNGTTWYGAISLYNL